MGGGPPPTGRRSSHCADGQPGDGRAYRVRGGHLHEKALLAPCARRSLFAAPSGNRARDRGSRYLTCNEAFLYTSEHILNGLPQHSHLSDANETHRSHCPGSDLLTCIRNVLPCSTDPESPLHWT